MFLSRFKIQAMYAQLSDFGIVNREGCKIVWQLAAQAFRYGLQKGSQFQVRCDGVIDFEQNLLLSLGHSYLFLWDRRKATQNIRKDRDHSDET